MYISNIYWIFCKYFLTINHFPSLFTTSFISSNIPFVFDILILKLLFFIFFLEHESLTDLLLKLILKKNLFIIYLFFDSSCRIYYIVRACVKPICWKTLNIFYFRCTGILIKKKLF